MARRHHSRSQFSGSRFRSKRQDHPCHLPSTRLPHPLACHCRRSITRTCSPNDRYPSTSRPSGRNSAIRRPVRRRRIFRHTPRASHPPIFKIRLVPHSRLLTRAFLRDIGFFLHKGAFRHGSSLVRSMTNIVRNLHHARESVNQHIIIIILHLVSASGLMYSASNVRVFTRQILTFRGCFFRTKARSGRLPFFLCVCVVSGATISCHRFSVIGRHLQEIRSIRKVNVVFISMKGHVTPTSAHHSRVRFKVFTESNGRVFVFMFSPPIRLRSLMQLTHMTQPYLRPVRTGITGIQRSPILRPISYPRRSGRRRGPPYCKGTNRRNARFVLLSHAPCFSRVVGIGRIPVLFLLFLSSHLSHKWYNQLPQPQGIHTSQSPSSTLQNLLSKTTPSPQPSSYYPALQSTRPPKSPTT